MKKIYNIISGFTDFIQDMIYKNNKNIRKCLDKNYSINYFNLRDKGTIDEHAAGGGLIYGYDPIYKTIMDNNLKNILFLSPDGTTLNQNIVCELSKLNELTIICTRYEGFDSRLYEIADYNISIGDFVISNGEIASLVLLDAILRFNGTVKDKSLQDSFLNNRLDCDNYGKSTLSKEEIPLILKSGNHKLIEEWKITYMLFKTIFFRKDLIKKLTKFEEKKIKDIIDYCERILGN